MGRASLVLIAFLIMWGALPLDAALGAGRATAVTAHGAHTCALTAGGGVKCWGENQYGQLGDGTTTQRETPTDVSGLTAGVAAVAVGAYHTCALTTGGGLKCWGANGAGALGDGTTTSRSTPIDVVGLTSGVAAVTAGWGFTCALTTGGGLKCWGDNRTGEVGDGSWDWYRITPTDVVGLTSGVAAVAAGDSHACAVTTGGGVKCWGNGGNGQLGHGGGDLRKTPTDVVGLASGVVAVTGGERHTCALTTGGGVKCWGADWGTLTNQYTPADVPALASGVAAVTAGGHHTCALTTGGGVKCWGDNQWGQLGDGTTIRRATPADVPGFTGGVVAVAGGASHSCVATAGGGVKCWGYNDVGQLGDGTTTQRLTPTEVAGLATGAAAAAAGGYHTCALTAAGGAKCWGYNYDGQLGDGTTASRYTPTEVSGLASGVVAVAAGNSHTCAVTTGGGAKCWGRNEYGQLGDGTTAYYRTTPTDVSGLTSGVIWVAAGPFGHTCAVTTEGGVKCWGSNGAGQLGDGTTAQRLTPTDVVDLASGVVSVAAGAWHTCAVTTGGGVKCWGDNWSGQLGDGTTTQRETPVDVSGLTSGVAAVTAGDSYTCAVTTAGGVKCWGWNADGQLGDGTTVDRATPTDVSGLTSGVVNVTAGTSHACAVTTGGGVKCWGVNTDGQLGDGTTTDRLTPTDVSGLASGVASVAAGDRHTCALTTAGGVQCWGRNEYGQLGDPASAPRLSPTRTRGFGQIDFDRDDVADVAVYRPTTGTWFSLDSSTTNTSYRHQGWGMQAQGDTPAPGDYDGDGVIDPTVFRPGTGTWFILESHAGFTTWRWFGWGDAADTLMPGDYDGDGTTDAAVYRPSTGQWFVLPSSSTFDTGWAPIVFGVPAQGDVAVAGDFDGDGKRDPAVYRPSTGTWFWLKSSTDYVDYEFKGWGVQAQGDTPAPGDYDGDGKTDPCVYRPGTGTWFILESHANHTTWSWFGWGTATDTLAPADYDGDGRTDAAVYRPNTGEWWVRPSGGSSAWNVVFGQTGDVPLSTIR